MDNLGPAHFLDLLVSFVPQNSIVVFIQIDLTSVAMIQFIAVAFQDYRGAFCIIFLQYEVPLMSSLCNKPVDERIA